MTTALRPIYTTRGEHVAFCNGTYLFTSSGEWIGFVDSATMQVFSIDGAYAGYIHRDGRILRKRALDEIVPLRTPPPRPQRPALPSSVPLPPMFSELGFDTVDVLEEMPDLLHTVDVGELRPDLD